MEVKVGKELEETLKVTVRVHFDDNESDKGTVRYLLDVVMTNIIVLKYQ